MFGDLEMFDELLASDVVFAIAVSFGTEVLLLLPGNRGSTFAMLVLCTKMAAASSTERILLNLLRTAS